MKRLLRTHHRYSRKMNMTRLAILILLLLPYALLRAQAVMAGIDSGDGVRLFPGDAAVLELREVKTWLSCAVTPARTELGFDLVFHAGHTAHVKLHDLEGEGNVLTSVFRVTPLGNPDKPIYFEQKWRVPRIPEDAGGTVALDSSRTDPAQPLSVMVLLNVGLQFAGGAGISQPESDALLFHPPRRDRRAC